MNHHNILYYITQSCVDPQKNCAIIECSLFSMICDNAKFGKISVLNFFCRKNVDIRRFIAGSLAGVTSQSLTYPLDVARARMAVTHNQEFSSLKRVGIQMDPSTGMNYLFYSIRIGW